MKTFLQISKETKISVQLLKYRAKRLGLEIRREVDRKAGRIVYKLTAAQERKVLKYMELKEKKKLQRLKKDTEKRLKELKR